MKNSVQYLLKDGCMLSRQTVGVPGVDGHHSECCDKRARPGELGGEGRRKPQQRAKAISSHLPKLRSEEKQVLFNHRLVKQF